MAASTVEAWARSLIVTTDMSAKLSPPSPPTCWSEEPGVVPRAPGRPEGLRQAKKSPKRPKRCTTPLQRAKLLHAFAHHELQAAELFAWALLRFHDAPPAFRRGLLRICLDELRHTRAYVGQLERLGFRFGDFEIRDWFWDRVPSCATPAAFVACMGLGFEAGNLDHSARFADAFEAAGDAEGANVQRVVGRDEIAHVRFAAKWFAEFTGETSFERWLDALPSPLSPMVMRGRPLNRSDRVRAGQSETFLAALEAWEPSAPAAKA
ncbi:MAG: DUF455 family protein [Myxococcota bacterium]